MAVLQGIGIGPANDYSGFFHANQMAAMNRNRQDNLALRKQGRMDQNQEFYEKSFDPSKHVTGTIYDGYVADGYNDLTNQAAKLAQEGKSIPEIQMVIGQKAQALSAQYNTIKQMNKQIEDYAGRFKGQPGYNAEAIISGAKQAAFQTPDGKMKDATQLDPNTNFVEKYMEENPEKVSNDEGLYKALNSSKRDISNPRTVTEVAGHKYKTGYNSELYPWQELTPEKDKFGNAVGVQTHGDTVQTDNGPVKVASEPVYNDFMHRVGVAPAINAMTKQAFQEAGGDMPRTDSPQWKMMQKHVLHDWLDRNSAKTYSPVTEQTETAPAAKVELIQHDPGAYYDNLRKESEARSAGTTQGKEDVKGPGKTNVAQAIGGVFNNDPNYTGGDMVDIGGRKVIDIKSKMPGGTLKFGKDAKDEYSGVYYDPQTREIIAQQGKETHTIPESQAGQFVARVAEANGMPMSKVRAELNKAGFQNGKFGNAQPSDFSVRMAQADQAATEKHNAHVDDSIGKDKFENFKGMKVPVGVVVL
jgi:hypothetical protein